MNYGSNIMNESKHYIFMYGKNILINTNQSNILKYIINYFKDYTFDCKKDIDFTIYILINNKLYYDNKIQHLCTEKYNNNEVYYLIFKRYFIIVDKVKKRMTILFKDIDDDFLQDICRIILNLLYKLLEEDNTFLIEAGGVSINKKTTLIIGEKNIVKDILNNLLIQNYNYVGVEYIGLKEIDDEMLVFNFPEKTKIKEKFNNKLDVNTKLNRIVILEHRWNLEKNKYLNASIEELKNILEFKHKINCKKYINYFNTIFNINSKMKINYKKIYQNISVVKLIYTRYDISEISKSLTEIII